MKPIRAILWAFAAMVVFIVLNHKDEPSAPSSATSVRHPVAAQPEAKSGTLITDGEVTDNEKVELETAQLEHAEAQMAVALQDPNKVRLMECIGVNPWKAKPDVWTAPTEQECAALEKRLGLQGPPIFTPLHDDVPDDEPDTAQ